MAGRKKHRHEPPCDDPDQEERHGKSDRRPRQGQDRAACSRSTATPAACWWKACMMIKRHTRPESGQADQGRHRREGSSIHVSNVMVLTSGGVPTRIGYKVETEGGVTRRTRVARKTGEALDKK